MKNTSSSFGIQIFQGIISLFFLFLLGIMIFRPDLAEQAIHFVGGISTQLGHWNFLIIVCVSLIESFPVIGILVPGQQILLVVGGFYGQSYFIPAVLAAGIGAILGNWIGYILGVHYGIKFLDRYGDLFALGKIEQKILAKRIQKNGATFIILGKFHNFTRAFVPFLAGAFSMKSTNFWKYNIIGSLLWSFTILLLGVFFTRYINIVLDWISWFFLAIFVGIVLYITLYKRKEFMEYLHEKQKELQ